MKSMRYIVTRPCLQAGSLSILKYLEATFPQSGPATFVDDRGDEHSVVIDTERQQVTGMAGLYQTQHLGVNDVLVITALAAGRYQVEAIVKPHAPLPLPRREGNQPPETRRVVVSSTAHVREVRMQEIPATHRTESRAPEAVEAASPLDGGGHEVRVTEVRASAGEQLNREQPQTGGAEVGRPHPQDNPPARSQPAPASAELASAELPTRAPRAAINAQNADAAATGTAHVAPASSPDTQLAELARLTGYRLDNLGGGVLRLKAELGAVSYAVLVALDERARSAPAWQEESGPQVFQVVLCSETEQPEGSARLTHEALAALIEHARLAPLSSIDLRGYWQAGHVDLESAASVAELVSAHLAQRGIFSFVLLTLAQQPAHSVVSVPRLAEKLGSGVNHAELGSILETLSRAPFLALTPLPGGQFLLRVGVPDLLTDLAEYADGVRRRVRTPASAGDAVGGGVTLSTPAGPRTKAQSTQRGGIRA